MYERHFGFSVKPFCLTPDPAFLYSSPRHAKALSILEYGLESQAPFSLLTGDIGSGKTLLVGSLLRKFGDQFVIGLVNNSHRHFSSIGGWVASALGLSPRDKSDIAIYEAMVESFVQHYAKGRRTLLVFDEAQNLSVEILEELRLLSNVNSEKDLVLQILLVGQPELRVKLNRPELKQFAQRVSVSFHLTALEKHETHDYIRHRLQVAGGNPSLFSPGAIDLIHERAKGVPRLVNQLCDFALVHAYAEGRVEIDACLVTQALNDSRSGFALLPASDAEADAPDLMTNGSERSPAPVNSVAAEIPTAAEPTVANRDLRTFEALTQPQVAQPQVAQAEPQQFDPSISTVSDGSKEITDVVAPWKDVAAQDQEAAFTANDVWRRNQEAMASAVSPFKKKSRFRRALAVAAMVALAIAGAAWWRLYNSHRTFTAGKPEIAPKSIAAAPAVASTNAASASEPPPDVPSPTVASAKPSVPSLMWAARAAFSDKRQQLPRADAELRGDSALELYNRVLLQESSNEEALEGIRQLFAAGNARIQSDLSDGKFEDAARIATLLQVGADPNFMREIKANIAAARPKWFATRARASLAAGDLAGAERLLSQASAAGANPNDVAGIRRAADAAKLELQLSSMADQVKAAIDSGALLDPATDNANTRLRAMLSVSRSDARTLREQHDLEGALLARAQDATHRDQFDVAQRFIAAAAEINPSSEARYAQQQLRDEMGRVAQPTAAAAQASVSADAKVNETLTGSAANSSAHILTGSDEPKYIAARTKSPLAAVYPNSAADLRVQGFVTVEFTIKPDGKASDVTVVDSKPSGIFENAAIEAVRRGNFDTSEVVDHQPRRARVKLTFKPD
jgi:general secretion pathway protein A